MVVTCNRNTSAHMNRCLETLAAQQYDNFTVVVVDDASTDDSAEVATAWCATYGWDLVIRAERQGAVKNQVEAIRRGCTDPDDVIVFVDGDDRLARTDTFDILNREYDRGALVTFGSYAPDPPDAGCAPAKPYRRNVVRQNAYRRCTAPHSYNHLRTFTYGIFQQMDDADFKDDRGEWFQSTPDAVMMFPAMELARGAVHFIPETLLLYTSDLGHAEWRDHPERVDYVNQTVLGRPPK